MTSATDTLSGKGHKDENFPVASLLIAPENRGPILAFYRFVRAGDDVSDNAALSPAEKIALLDGLEASLLGHGEPDPFADPLREALAARDLSPRHAQDLLDAFRQDARQSRYATWDELLGYCALSAMPVGRFVLDLHGEDRSTWTASDALCAALQVINHTQDCGKDLAALDRVYMPETILARHGASVADLAEPRSSPALLAALREINEGSADLLARSAPFAGQIADRRLALEVSVIQTLAEALVRKLRTGDPLAGKVHASKPEALVLATFGILRGLAGRLRRPAGRPAASR